MRQGNIGAAVRSLPPDSVIVVDDFSEDKTAEEARDAGAGVLPAPQPPMARWANPTRAWKARGC